MEQNDNLNIFNNIENSPTPVFFLRDKVVEFANNSFAKLVEYEATDLKGMALEQLFLGDELLQMVKKDLFDTEKESNNIIRALTKNLNFKILLVSSFVINQEENRYLVFCKDITNSSLEQKKLAQAKLYVDSIFSNLDDGVIVIDAEKKIINLNNGALAYGMSKVFEIVNLVTKNVDILSAGWADKYNRKIHFIDHFDKDVYIRANICKFVVSGSFNVYIINFSDITHDVLLEKEIAEKNRIVQDQFNRMDKELKFARSIQENMVPGHFRKVEELHIYTEYRIANSMGGDYYEVMEDGNGRTMVAIFDVSGHGVASSLVVMMLKALLQALPLAQIQNSAEIFYYLQRGFKDKIPGKHFVAAVIMLYDHKSKILNCCTGGNYLPLIIKQDRVQELGKRGFAIGFIANPYFDFVETELNIGDKIVIFTDGIIEAKNADNQFYSQQRLIDLLSNKTSMPASKLKEVITEDLISFTGNIEHQNDDVTIMVIEAKNELPLHGTINFIDYHNNLSLTKLPQEFQQIILKIINTDIDFDHKMNYNIYYEAKRECEICSINTVSKQIFKELELKPNNEEIVINYDSITETLEITKR